MPRSTDPVVHVDPAHWLVAEAICKVYTMLGARRPDAAKRKRAPKPAAIIADAIAVGLRQLAAECPVPE